jgi:transposase
VAADLSYLTRDELLALVREQAKAIALLQRRVAELEELLNGKRGGGPLPGNKPTEPADAPPKDRKPRPHGFGRVRLAATEQQDHVFAACPDCGTTLMGGWVQRTREVLELPQTPLRVIEHRYIARMCPTCNRCKLPPPDLAGVVMGQQRLGVGLVSLIAWLRATNRLPLKGIQALLATLYGLQLSEGAIVSVLHRVAKAGAPAVAAIVEEVRASSPVQGDETGWRENGKNGYVWSFSTPSACVFTRGSRQGVEVDRVLGEAFEGVLVSDFYAGYDHYEGPHQRCWVHLLRDDHDLARLYPDDPVRQAWSAELRACYEAARALATPDPQLREHAYRQLTARLLQLAQRHVDDATAVVRRLCKRIIRYEAELFTFVRDPTVPADNNGAERRLRPLVTQRKISGGTRSGVGTTTAMTLATLFETWRLKGLPPLPTCRQLISSPQV